MRGEPGAARGEHAPSGTVYRPCDAPEVGIVVGHPSLAAIHLLRCLRTRYAQVADHLKEGLLGLCEVTYQCWPVVHLGVDVDGVLRVPGGFQLVIPHTLQVGRLSAGLRAGDEQVAPILHHQGYQSEVCAVEGLQPLVCRQLFLIAIRQCQTDAVILRLVFLQMIVEQLGIALADDARHRLDILSRGIAAHVVVVHEVGGSGDIDGGRRGIAHTHVLSVVHNLTVGRDADAALGL